MHRGLGLGGAKELLLQRTLCVGICTFVLVAASKLSTLCGAERRSGSAWTSCSSARSVSVFVLLYWFSK
jgi:hypothetical protein